MSVIIPLLLVVSMACKKNNTVVTGDANNKDTVIKTVDTTQKDTTVVNQPLKRRYLALGDSYTIGEAVGEHERYPVQLKDSLAKFNFNIYDLNIIARTGWTTANLLTALQATPPTGTYDLVTLLIGVNNQYQGLSLQQYSTEFSTLLEKSIQYAGNNKNNVVVISIPDYSVVPFAKYSDTVKIRTQLEQFNLTNKNIAGYYGVKYTDVFSLSQEARFNKSLVAKDSLHFSGLEYAKWTNLLLPLAKTILK